VPRLLFIPSCSVSAQPEDSTTRPLSTIPAGEAMQCRKCQFQNPASMKCCGGLRGGTALAVPKVCYEWVSKAEVELLRLTLCKPPRSGTRKPVTEVDRPSNYDRRLQECVGSGKDLRALAKTFGNSRKRIIAPYSGVVGRSPKLRASLNRF
jgi:hypothetical protein